MFRESFEASLVLPKKTRTMTMGWIFAYTTDERKIKGNKKIKKSVVDFNREKEQQHYPQARGGDRMPKYPQKNQSDACLSLGDVG